MRISTKGANLVAIFQYHWIDVEKIKGLPQRRFDSTNKTWAFKPIVDNIKYVEQWWPDAQWDDDAIKVKKAVMKMIDSREVQYVDRDKMSLDVLDIQFKLPPYDHQKKAYLLGRDLDVFAYLMDQGTGKTKVLIDDAAHNYRKHRIDAVLILCPNSIKTNWINVDGDRDELEKHCPPDVGFEKACWFSNPTKEQAQFIKKILSPSNNLKFLSANIESLHVPRIYKYLEEYCKKFRTLIVVDESTRIKNRTAKRTKNAIKLRQLCPIARIMSGTPLIKSPLDAYAQFMFLDPNIIGSASYQSFQHRYAVMGGFQGYQVMRYINLGELSDKIVRVSFRVTKDECLDLPNKVYSKRRINMTDDQRKAYKAAREKAQEAIIDDTNEYGYLRSQLVLTQLIRLQQITSGFVPIINEMDEQEGVEPIPGANPKIEEVLRIFDEVDGRIIVWCKYTAELEALSAALQKAGHKIVTFYGKTDNEARIAAKEAFEYADSTTDVKGFIGNLATGGVGLTLNASHTVIYFSNSFSTEHRVQSEDRTHRIGQTCNVDYIDLYCPGTIDVKIIQTLRENKQIADSIMRDGYKEWI